jgi:GNAT superfamily N-acetyltransferase
MIFREARTSDIQQLQLVRQCVRENVLSDPSKVTEYDYLRYLTIDGKGWVCETGSKIIGFAIIDCKHHKIWALFVKPAFAGKHVGKTLLDLMLNWYFSKDEETLSLNTAPHTRAEQFYTMQGWTPAGRSPDNEIVFQMQYATWKAAREAKNN